MRSEPGAISKFGTALVAIRHRFAAHVEICRIHFCFSRAMNEFSLDLARLSANVGFPLPQAEKFYFHSDEETTPVWTHPNDECCNATTFARRCDFAPLIWLEAAAITSRKR
jgi:hypothetical protein